MNDPLPWRSFAVAMVAMVVLPVTSHAQVLIHNATIVDGTGTPGFRGSVRIEGDRIAAVGNLQPLPGDIVVRADGLVLAPGFIDTHSHHDRNIEDERSALAAVSQGITTIVRGQDGVNEYDGDDYLSLAAFNERIVGAPVSVNIASFAGHNSIRTAVLGESFARPANDDEIGAMAALLRLDMSAGALGLASGLEYEPGMYATTEEVVSLAAIASAAGGRYISHIRSEEDGFWDAIDEAIQIGTEADIPVQISHIKLSTTGLWGNVDRLLERLDTAREEGVEVTADIYPYTYWQSTVTVLFADRNFHDRDTAEYVLRELVTPDGLIIARFEAEPLIAGMSIAEIADLWGTDPADALMTVAKRGDAFNKESNRSTETVIAKSMRDREVAALMAWPHTNIGSDGFLDGEHPRGTGTFPRVLAHYVREGGALSLEVAIHKMTALAAQHVGIPDRGILVPGAYADLVLFDPATVQDQATIENPALLAIGIERVWVNGLEVFRDGAATGAYPGVIVGRSGAK